VPPAIDTSAVPEPRGLVAFARVNRPDALIGAVGGWTKLPLPTGAELVRSLSDEAVGDVIDLSQPVDVALTVGISLRGVDPAIAIAVAVRSFEQAKAKLGEQHRLVAGANGDLRVERARNRDRDTSRPAGGDDQGDDDDDAPTCVLAHAPEGAARLVCGGPSALEALTPYLARTMPRAKWTSDVHLELRPEPVRRPLSDLRAGLPMLAQSVLGVSSPAVRGLLDASIGEVVDLLEDADKVSIDGDVKESGLVATARFDFRSTRSTFARMTTMTDRAGEAPPAFWHLPGDADTAFFGRGSDPKLFERPRELVAALLLEATDAAGMPEAERKAAGDLVANRMLSLFTNGVSVYAKGHDAAGVDRAVRARAALKPDDTPAQAEARRVLLEQALGWHLYAVAEPIASVGPILKDWSALWNRPAFAKWASAQGAASGLPRLRVAPSPAGVALPKETVHLEISVPRDDIDDERGAAQRAPPRPGGPDPKRKKIARKPVVFHVLAVPDGATTWLALGIDARLVATKAAQALSTATDAGTLGKAAGQEPLRDGKLNAAAVTTLRGLTVLSAIDAVDDRSAFSLLGTLPNKGMTPVFFTARAERGPAGVVGTLRLPRAFIEDAVKLAMAAR
jgi:hypothetical protein